jgi:molecular chaperone IbpA
MGNQYNRFLPSALGFERMFDILDHASDVLNSSNVAFPPANVVRVDDYNFVVELAIAGYKLDEVEIQAEKNLLKISGKKEETDERTYLIKGIAGRSFERRFVLADTVVVGNANLADGILSVELHNVIPEEQKPRKIAINKA